MERRKLLSSVLDSVVAMMKAAKSSSKCCDHNTDGEIMIFGVRIKPDETQKRPSCCCSCSDPAKKKQRTRDDLDYKQVIIVSALDENPPPPPPPPKENSDPTLSRTLSLDLSLSLKPPNSSTSTTASSTRTTGKTPDPVNYTTTATSTDLNMFTCGASTSGSSSSNGTSTRQEEEEQVAAPIPLAVVLPHNVPPAAAAAAADDPPMNAVEWTINKPLTASDCSNVQCRLMISKKDVIDHILRYLNRDDVAKVCSDEGLPLRVCDCDIRGGYEVDNMKLQFWKSSKSYVLKGNWFGGFVSRRELVQKMRVGLAWDPLNYRLLFSVLDRNQV